MYNKKDKYIFGRKDWEVGKCCLGFKYCLLYERLVNRV